MFILSGDEHQLMPNENRVIFRLQNENGRWNRESYVLSTCNFRCWLPKP